MVVLAEVHVERDMRNDAGWLHCYHTMCCAQARKHLEKNDREVCTAKMGGEMIHLQNGASIVINGVMITPINGLMNG